jgi:hypothetical protein
MSSIGKLEVPKLKTDITPAIAISWLHRVEDTYDGYVALTDSKKLTVDLRILFAGLALEEPTAQSWWEENRTELKALSSWNEFSVKFLERFAPDGWKMEALLHFYSIYQGSSTFSDFAKDLQTAKNALEKKGNLAVTDPMYRNHLLFHANPILMRRVMAVPTFDLNTIQTDPLLNLMTSTWESLRAEGVPSIHSHRSPSVPHSSSASASAPSSRLAPLTDAEKKRLTEAAGCWRCRKVPGDEGWTSHVGRTCPGDEARGITPGRDFIAVKRETVGFARAIPRDVDTSESDSEDQPEHMPP